MELMINFWAVLVAAIAGFAIGWAWFSPFLFVKPWMRMRGIDPATMQGGKMVPWHIIVEFIAVLITAYVLAHFVVVWGLVAGTMDIANALMLGFWVWLGFYAPVFVSQSMWEQRPWGLFLINAGQRLVAILVMSLIIGLWH